MAMHARRCVEHVHAMIMAVGDVEIARVDAQRTSTRAAGLARSQALTLKRLKRLQVYAIAAKTRETRHFSRMLPWPTNDPQGTTGSRSSCAVYKRLNVGIPMKQTE